MLLHPADDVVELGHDGSHDDAAMLAPAFGTAAGTLKTLDEFKRSHPKSVT